MSSLFRNRSSKSPRELVRSLKTNIAVVSDDESSDKKKDKAREEIAKTMSSMKTMVCGNEHHTPQTEAVAALAQTFYDEDVILYVVRNLRHLDFEGKKDWVQIFSILVKRQIGTRYPTVEHLINISSTFVPELMNSYADANVALSCGSMLRDYLKHDAANTDFLHMDAFYKIFELVEVSTFDIASDAFSTFKSALTCNKNQVADFLLKNYDKFFAHYVNLLNSQNYVTKRQSLKLLGELLLDRHNFSIMQKYISQPDNLKMMMNNLRAPSKNIQFEAFHVFKVFVANPKKTKPILDILLKNKAKLIEFLSNFLTERADDDQFNDEKAYLIKQIKDLQSC